MIFVKRDCAVLRRHMCRLDLTLSGHSTWPWRSVSVAVPAVTAQVPLDLGTIEKTWPTDPYSRAGIGKLPLRGQIGNVSGFAGHFVSITTVPVLLAASKQPQIIRQRMCAARFQYSFIYKNRLPACGL